MTRISINKKFYDVPTAWNELSQKQLLQVMDCLFTRQYTGEQCLLSLLKILCNMSWWDFFRAPVSARKMGDDISGMEEYLYLNRFLLDSNTLTKQLIPDYRGLYGPASDFDNLRMCELAICDNVFLQWSEEKDSQDQLNYLIALLYRPAKEGYDFVLNPDGDPRQPFNSNISRHYADALVKKWPLNVKLAIANWYAGCRLDLVEVNEDVFSEGSGEPSKYGLAGLMLDVAESKTLGDFRQVEDEYVHTVMMHLNEAIRKAKEQEKAMKK